MQGELALAITPLWGTDHCWYFVVRFILLSYSDCWDLQTVPYKMSNLIKVQNSSLDANEGELALAITPFGMEGFWSLILLFCLNQYDRVLTTSVRCTMPLMHSISWRATSVTQARRAVISSLQKHFQKLYLATCMHLAVIHSIYLFSRTYSLIWYDFIFRSF